MIKRIKITVGAQGSGKSTYSKSFDSTSTVIVERDVCRHAIQMVDNDGYSRQGVNWPAWDWNNEPQVTECIRGVMMDAIGDDAIETIIVSDTHSTPRLRKLITQLIDECATELQVEYELEWVWINTPLDVCLERNAKRTFPIPEHVIAGVCAAMEREREWLEANATIHDNWSDTSKHNIVMLGDVIDLAGKVSGKNIPPPPPAPDEPEVQLSLSWP